MARFGRRGRHRRRGYIFINKGFWDPVKRIYVNKNKYRRVPKLVLDKSHSYNNVHSFKRHRRHRRH